MSRWPTASLGLGEQVGDAFWFAIGVDQPPQWWEWGPEAFAEARRRDTPILLSVGYAACHWCHVPDHRVKPVLWGSSPTPALRLCVRAGQKLAPKNDVHDTPE